MLSSYPFLLYLINAFDDQDIIMFHFFLHTYNYDHMKTRDLQEKDEVLQQTPHQERNQYINYNVL